jgi:DNA-binding NarL/FixJ family response regulator
VEAIRSLRLLENSAKLLVISGYVTEQIAAECREAGVAELLSKPVELNRLAEIIGDLLSHRATDPG